MLSRKKPMKRTRGNKGAGAEVKRYWASLPFGCEVCGREAVLHHILSDAPGKKGRRDHLLVVKICPNHHNMTNFSVHGLGSEAEFLRLHGVDLVAIAVRNRDEWLARNG